jgi:hypothetical protein
MQPITHPRWTSSKPPPPMVGGNAEFCPDDDLVPVYAIVWIASVARVIAATIRQETFGTELTLALLAALFLPVLLLEPLAWLLRPRRHESRCTTTADHKIAPVIALVPKDRTAGRRPDRI